MVGKASLILATQVRREFLNLSVIGRGNSDDDQNLSSLCRTLSSSGAPYSWCGAPSHECGFGWPLIKGTLATPCWKAPPRAASCALGLLQDTGGLAEARTSPSKIRNRTEVCQLIESLTPPRLPLMQRHVSRPSMRGPILKKTARCAERQINEKTPEAPAVSAPNRRGRG